MKANKLIVAGIFLFACGSLTAESVSWIDGLFAVAPPGWSITPANPTESDVIQFNGPTDKEYGNSCAAESEFGGTPYLDVNHATRTIELKFQGPPPIICTLQYEPAVGFSGDFGPLGAGIWTFKCTHPKIPFNLSFTVTTGGGGGNIIYVDPEPLVIWIPDGSSWLRAYAHLQDALAVAQPGDAIHVADGVYTPDKGGGKTPGDRTASFDIPDNVTVLGGFAGWNAPNPDLRDPDLTPSVLSGDLNANDLWGILFIDDNSHHVVSSSAGGVLDGFSITAGNADGLGGPGYGGGVLLTSSTLTIKNCKIFGNKASWGAGVACVDGTAPSLEETEITGNWAVLSGGALYNDDANVSMLNCLLTGNLGGAADVFGGDAIFNTMGSLDITNCTIADNRPGHVLPPNGQAIVSFVWGPGFVDTISIKNSIIRNGGQEIWSTEPGIVTLYYNNIEGGPAGYGGLGNIDQDPLFKNPGVFGIEGQWFYDDDGYTLSPGSPSIDAGRQSHLPPGVLTDLNGNARVLGAEVDQGAYEGFGLPPAVVLVPNVVGLPQFTAQFTIVGAGLTVGTVTQSHHATIPAGNVISQNPVGGQTANVGAAVDLVISQGPSTILVPNVVGLTQVNAQFTITGAGLTVGTITQAYHATVPSGNVISQNPVGGTPANPGDAVNLVISKGPDPGGSWIFADTKTVTYNVPSSPPGYPITINHSKIIQFIVNFNGEYRLEIAGVPAVGGSWTITPNAGPLSSGTSSVTTSIQGTGVNVSSLPPNTTQVVAEIDVYVRPL